ncbi:DsbA family oxidoreductase [Variovorax sp. OV329]|uniref:DsbA family oxidoreductase n=1 Tax=Variovorax sp. OV329 TaxID=1882825 RepID=UPI0008F1F283|nr:DsbA family oxidoreductase [Variovorax sp. OV329]SFM57781.1 Predicted dithiol-disulfide isomerase, DsbA family [Variovorax sp. OV329]
MSTPTPNTPRQLRIDFVSDVSCPWCAVGLGALEQAMASVSPEIEVELHFQPFELNPDMPREGQDSVEHLVEKYGIDEAQVKANGDRIRERGATVGFDFDMARRKRVWNTFDAHRLLHWAEETDVEKQRALKKSLFKAYFTDGLNPSDPELLVRLAGEAGLDAQRAREILAGDEFDAATRARERLYTGAGIHSVPAIIIDNQHLISGGQPAEIFERALRQIAGAAPQQTAEA